MLIPQIYINIEQKSSSSDKTSRNSKYELLFVNSFEYNTTYKELSNTGSITIPRKTYIKDVNTGKISTIRTSDKNVNKYEYESRFNSLDKSDNIDLDFASTTNKYIPIIRTGDVISFELFYNYFEEKVTETENSNGDLEFDISETINETKRVISNNNYITQVVYDDDLITIKYENYIWLCKQYAMNNIQYMKSGSIDNQIKDIIVKTLNDINKLNGTNLKLEIDDFKSNLENFTLYTDNETFSQFLKRIKDLFHFEVYFIDNILNIRYVIPQKNTKTNDLPLFSMEDNIISDNLEYKLNTDIKLSAVGNNTINEDSNEQTKSGKSKKKRTKLEVYSYINKEGNIKSVQIGTEKTGKLDLMEKVPSEESGERRSFPFPLARNIDELAKFVEDSLVKYNYSGFRGSFTTFLSPVVESGDNINIYIDKNSEKNGTYRVSSVRYKIDNSGGRQDIVLENIIK